MRKRRASLRFGRFNLFKRFNACLSAGGVTSLVGLGGLVW
jgi:hypothetical protein